MTEYDLDFLKENGFLKSSIDMEDKCDTAEGTIKTVSYLFDPTNRLAYFDDFNVEDIASILNVLKEKRNFDYYWFWKDGRIYAYRTFGENKQFIFNTQHSRRTEYVKSKKDKLSKFSYENPTALFDVKDVISLFYRRLWDLRLKLAKAIKGGLDDRERILAAQRLLDRLIFTYFIAEKGIIYGIDKRGRRQELSARNLFKYLIEISGDFHSLLNILFFEYLNDSKKNDMPIQGAEGYSLFIPYLNGGLFRERQITTPAGESIGESKLEIEGFDWKELIGALNEYNWIIDGYTHAEDEDTIGNLTPEILGHIYEKFVISVSELDDIDVDDLATTREGELKKGNKKIGAYYTPEVITKYIAENTIFPFAMDKLNLGEKYENFVDFHEVYKDDADTLSRFNDVLKDITVLDPAVGSGAFPMAAADILFDWRRKCKETLDEYHLRREIIINNLHGVDIMEGAVEICMLRLWLWLIAAVDTEKEIEALPNIDFNIFEGNSLIGYVNEKEIADLKPKKKPKARWDTLTHKQFTMENWGEEGIFKLFQQRNNKIREYRNASGGRAESLRKEIRQMTDEFNGLLDGKLLNELQDKGIEIDEGSLLELKPFHWVMQFSDVFEKGGFDVVIGNPPYFSLETASTLIKEYLKRTYEIHAGKADILYYFYSKGVDILIEHGRLGFITSRYFMEATYAKKLRNYVQNKTKINSIIDFSNINVFVGVGIHSAILILEKGCLESESESNKVKIIKFLDSIEDINYINTTSIIRESNHVEAFSLFQKKLSVDGWRLTSELTFEILSNMEHNSWSLIELCEIEQGQKSGLNKVFAVDKETIKKYNLEIKLLKKLIKNSHINRYSADYRKLYLIYTDDDTNIDEYPNTKQYFEAFKHELKNRAEVNEDKYNWFRLQRPRDSRLFNAPEKLVVPYRAPVNRFAYDTRQFYNDGGDIRIVVPRNGCTISLKYILSILNSKLLTFYYMFIGRKKGDVYEYFVEPLSKIPVKKIAKNNKTEYEDIKLISEYLLYLYNTTKVDNFINIATLLDQIILDSLVYSLYFSSKFASEGIPTDLAKKVAPHLEPINYDRWAELEYKDELTEAEMKEKDALEKKNIETIKKVYHRLRDDKEIQTHIDRIKAHPWVRVVEGE